MPSNKQLLTTVLIVVVVLAVISRVEALRKPILNA